MKKLAYSILALATAHFSSGAVVISSLSGGELSISIDAPITFTSNSTTFTGDAFFVFSNAYSSDQTASTTSFSSTTIALSSPTISTPGPSNVYIAPATATDIDPNDFSIAFTFETKVRDPGQSFTVSIGAATTSSAVPLPTNSGSYNLYLADGDGTRFTDQIPVNVTFSAIPEPSLLAALVGGVSLTILLLRRRR